MEPNIQNPMKQQEKSWYQNYTDPAMRWVEDTYLKYFGENRTSYGVKDSLKKTEVTGVKEVSDVQSSVGDSVGNLVGSKGIGGQVGDGIDKHVLRGNV